MSYFSFLSHIPNCIFYLQQISHFSFLTHIPNCIFHLMQISHFSFLTHTYQTAYFISHKYHIEYLLSHKYHAIIIYFSCTRTTILIFPLTHTTVSLHPTLSLATCHFLWHYSDWTSNPMPGWVSSTLVHNLHWYKVQEGRELELTALKILPNKVQILGKCICGLKNSKLNQLNWKILYHKTEQRDDNDNNIIITTNYIIPSVSKGDFGEDWRIMFSWLNSRWIVYRPYFYMVYKSLQGTQNRYATSSLPQFVLQVWSNGTNFYSLSGKLWAAFRSILKFALVLLSCKSHSLWEPANEGVL